MSTTERVWTTQGLTQSQNKNKTSSVRTIRRRINKTTPCSYWAKGLTCPFGSRCWYGHDNAETHMPNDDIVPTESLVQEMEDLELKGLMENDGFKHCVRSSTPIQDVEKSDEKKCEICGKYDSCNGEHVFLEEMRVVSPHDVFQKKDPRSDLSMCSLYKTGGKCVLGDECFFRHTESKQ